MPRLWYFWLPPLYLQDTGRHTKLANAASWLSAKLVSVFVLSVIDMLPVHEEVSGRQRGMFNGLCRAVVGAVVVSIWVLLLFCG
jgi:hypothetical protein